ncbi:hypothetical protein Tgr7_2955 [Thioalkalivibrio sulfidiphilus HL-EbGr7]|uniref:Uncharacterized protein n=1 Tax=Thioalkalivibrio sulfidiphilus (strain HL-EbGR7) TaxID=396588 RepID=B8GPA7_THISH|nr:hypothetical protein Tgr7_2955 [Thioalkalivibrio sulfidiphilus HL-EbGr7]
MAPMTHANPQRLRVAEQLLGLYRELEKRMGQFKTE